MAAGYLQRLHPFLPGRGQRTKAGKHPGRIGKITLGEITHAAMNQFRTPAGGFFCKIVSSRFIRLPPIRLTSTKLTNYLSITKKGTILIRLPVFFFTCHPTKKFSSGNPSEKTCTSFSENMYMILPKGVHVFYRNHRKNANKT